MKYALAILFLLLSIAGLVVLLLNKNYTDKDGKEDTTKKWLFIAGIIVCAVFFVALLITLFYTHDTKRENGKIEDSQGLGQGLGQGLDLSQKYDESLNSFKESFRKNVERLKNAQTPSQKVQILKVLKGLKDWQQQLVLLGTKVGEDPSYFDAEFRKISKQLDKL